MWLSVNGILTHCASCDSVDEFWSRRRGFLFSSCRYENGSKSSSSRELSEKSPTGIPLSFSSTKAFADPLSEFNFGGSRTWEYICKKKIQFQSLGTYIHKNVKAAMWERIIMKFTQPRKVTITLSFPSSPTAISSVWKNRNNLGNNHATSKDDYCFAICYNFNIFSVKLNNSPKFHS